MKKRLISCHHIIKVALLYVLIIPFSLNAQPSESDLTTIILVRHAEKVDNSRDPDLSEVGYHRSEELAEIFSRVSFDAVYSTSFKRTQETVKPIAESNNLDIQSYDHQNPKSQVQKWIDQHNNETILVSGHSNSTPTFVNTILGNNHFDGNFDESDYGNILIITISETGARELLHLRY